MSYSLRSARNRDPRINYRGTTASRIDNLTDAVFGIAITLLIFNLMNPNSFFDLLQFTKTLPAFMLSIAMLMLIWNEHSRFAEVFSLRDSWLTVLNTVFIGLIIFYVYPLRFLTLFLTNLFFGTDISLNIRGAQVPQLMIYFGLLLFAVYFILFLMNVRALRIKTTLEMSDFEVLYTHMQLWRLGILFSVPLVSIATTILLMQWSLNWAGFVGGMLYNIYTPAMLLWTKRYNERTKMAPQ
ncbi:MAG: DUF1211 domain-containing protein [Bacteroidetes bacterium]|nr:DUF1211 domain-containing protein [Bacteroidota bacterium]